MPASLKIELDNKARLYIPGQAITGTVSVRDVLKSAFSLRNLRIRLLGEIATFQIVGAYGELREIHTVVDEAIDLLEGRPEVRITKDENEFPFRFVLPETAPPTIAVSESNRIRYALIAEIPRPGRFTANTSTKTAIKVTSVRHQEEKQKAVFIRMFGDIPYVANEAVVDFGNADYPPIAPKGPSVPTEKVGDSEEDEPLDVDLKHDEKIEQYEFEYDDDESDAEFDAQWERQAGAEGAVETVGGGVMRHQRIGVFGREFANNLLPAKKWGYGATHKHQLVLETVMPHTGVYTDRPLRVKARLSATGPLPPLVLHLVRVTLIESTFISAKGTSNNERRRRTLLRLQGPIDLTTATVHNVIDGIQNAFAPDTAATFSEQTMRRSYALNIHVQFYKGHIEDEPPLNKLHLNARHSLLVLGAADLDPVRPSSSSLFSFRSSARSIRS